MMMFEGTKRFNELIQKMPFCAIHVKSIFDHKDFKKNTGHNITQALCVNNIDRIYKIHIVFNPFINKFTLRQSIDLISLNPDNYIVSGDICVFDVIKYEHLYLAHMQKKTMQVLEDIGIPSVVVSIVNEY